ncbi:AsnC family protein [Paracidovorax cattleyae]|uniref:AsnC family protein n=2 Tax=Paracidovorax cattleyae TaxID=80868 RepID=A0A1H0R6V8_9BURK|nr:AsnC family protein [Paracidovorax cattleyae]
MIRSYGADTALDKLGEHVIVFSEITLGNHWRHDFRRFEEAVAGYREIVESYNVSGGGGYDYLLKIVAPGIGHFQSVMDRMLEADIGIERFASRIVLRHAQGRRGYPLDIIAVQKRWKWGHEARPCRLDLTGTAGIAPRPPPHAGHNICTEAWRFPSLPAIHHRKDFIMNTDQIKGTLKEAAGKVQQKTGEVFNSPEQQAKGVAKQVEGNVQKNYGDAKETIKDTTK